MDDFDRADRDDYLLDRAWDDDIRRADWDDLHGEWFDRPTIADAVRLAGFDKLRAAALGTELIIEEEFDG